MPAPAYSIYEQAILFIAALVVWGGVTILRETAAARPSSDNESTA